jgi:dihydrofolate synthase / folylpolyglutamate synthase
MNMTIAPSNIREAIMNYKESLEYLLKYADYERLPRAGIVWDLKRVESLLKRLDDPHKFARTVHVAGTKGKGSTSAMIASILKTAGYKTGLYTSPHLLSFTERIRVNGEPVSEEVWAKLVEDVMPQVEAENAEAKYGVLTTFEIYTAMAFMHFRNVKADFQVMEVGLGGRLDATNVVSPAVCVITSISFDHMDVLGDTLAKIAGEKSGIIKQGVPVVSAPQIPHAMEVIERIAREKKSSLVKVGQEVTWKKTGHDTEKQWFRLHGLKGDYDLQIPLLGEHQLENAANAVAAIETLNLKGLKPEHIIQGLANVDWPGRMQVLGKKPWVIVDGAHNAYSIEKLGKGIKEYFKPGKIKLILGFGNDKDIVGMAREAVKYADEIYLVASKHPKAVKGEVLAAEFAKYKMTPKVAQSVTEAIIMAKAGAAPNDVICAAGSIFVIAEVMEWARGAQ